MASELRVNSSTNRSGLGTITYTDSGPIVSGVGTFANGLTVDGTQTTVKSLKLTGDNYNANWFKTTNKLRFNDNSKATFGTADDLSIYHDGNHSYIEDTGTGNLLIKSDSVISIRGTTVAIKSADNSQTLIKGVENAGSELYYNGNRKFITTAQGIDVTGHSELDNVNISGVSTYAGQARFNGELVGSIISVSNSINIADKLIHSGDTDTAIRFPTNDTITAETAGSERLRITSNGRVGINSTSPTVPLDVVGSGKFSSALTVGGTLNASGTCTLGQTVSLNGTNPRLQFVDTNHDPDFSIYGNNARLVIYDDTNSAERLRINSSGVITLGTSTNTTLKAEICNSVSGHYFVSQCSDNNNGFEIYQQHGSTTTRNTLAVYNNSIGSKHLNFYVRGDNQVWISTVKNNTALVLDGTSSGTAYGETGGRIEFLMLNEVNQFTGNFAARISPYLQRGNNGFGLKFDVRHNASTTYKALDLTADYSVLPGLDNTITLGSSSYRWSNIYTADLHCSNEGSKNDVDGTWGDYTIQEGESDLFLINNRSGKKYKFNLTEVS